MSQPEQISEPDQGDQQREPAKDDTNISNQAVDKRYLEFTSEMFKIEVSNLPRNMNKFHMAKNLIENHFKLTSYRKIKLGKTKVFVTFSSAEDRDHAISIINDSEYKGQILEAILAEPKEDPYMKRRKLNDDSRDNKGGDDENSASGDEVPFDINKQVCPLYDRDYEIQLKIKTRNMKNILTMYRKIKKFNQGLKRDAPKLYEWNEANKAISCHFDGVEASPRINGYRNKCEFNVDRDGNCGFRIGRYKDGSAKVVHPPPDCPIINDKMFEIIDKFEQHLKDKSPSKLTGFDPFTHSGHVRQLTIRTNERKECLIIIDMTNNGLTEEETEGEIDKLRELFCSIENVVSIYSNISDKPHLTGMDQSVKLIHGISHLNEYMTVNDGRELQFRIGPQSFFQVNTKAAEVLYKTIGEIANLNKRTIVLDIGSGIGTISLSLAEQVGHVIGIEIIESAVEDAKFNAQKNGIKNVEFFVGKAEELIGVSLDIAKKIMYDYCNNEGEIVAIVDPPRAGFNTSFVKSLRASNVKKIVYVACDPKSNENLLFLCRPKSKAYQGEPFVPTRAKAIDLFPHTKACELVVLYERLDQVIPSVA